MSPELAHSPALDARHTMAMKGIVLVLSILTLSLCSLFADFLSPFADSPVGAKLSDHGQIRKVVSKAGGTNFMVKFRTDTGQRELPAEIPAKLITNLILEYRVKITATIRARDDAATRTKERYLEVAAIESAE